MIITTLYFTFKNFVRLLCGISEYLFVISSFATMRPNSALVFAQLLLLSAFAGRAASASNVQMFGGLKEQDPNNPVYKELAMESLEVYVKKNGLTDPHGVVEVTKATTQVVAGVVTRLEFIAILGYSATTCHSVILEKAWENIKQIDVTCDNLNKKSMQKRGIPGGLNQEDPNDPIYTQMAQDSLQKYAADSGVFQPYQVLKVNEVTKQVVAGYIYRINFDALLGYTDVINCQSEVFEQAWRNLRDIKVNCHRRDRRANQAPGGIAEKDVRDPKYTELAEESLEKYKQDNGLTLCSYLLRILKVTEQTVAGLITRIDFQARLLNSHDIICHSEIWEQPWVGSKRINVNCHNVVYNF